jgi:hypothetical protein
MTERLAMNILVSVAGVIMVVTFLYSVGVFRKRPGRRR